jgi:hypothetical protein
MVLFPDPEERNKGSLRPGAAEGKPLVLLLWEQENFRRDGESRTPTCRLPTSMLGSM